MTTQSNKIDLYLLFEERPWIKPFFKWHIWIIILGYPALIALANSSHFLLLPAWLKLWLPLVEALNRELPIFNNLAEAFARKAAVDRIDLMQHLLAYEWIVTPPLLLLMIVVTLWTPKAAWKRLAASGDYLVFLLLFSFSLVMVPCSIYWMIFGFDLAKEHPLWDWHRSDLTVPTIGFFFGCAIGCSVILIASLGGLITKIRMQSAEDSA